MVVAWLVPRETAAVLAQFLCTPLNHAPVYSVTSFKSHIGRVYACLAVTCHMHFWQNDRDLLRAIAVTRGWNGYRHKSQHRKVTLEKKILPPLYVGHILQYTTGSVQSELTEELCESGGGRPQWTPRP